MALVHSHINVDGAVVPIGTAMDGVHAGLAAAEEATSMMQSVMAQPVGSALETSQSACSYLQKSIKSFLRRLNKVGGQYQGNLIGTLGQYTGTALQSTQALQADINAGLTTGSQPAAVGGALAPTASPATADEALPVQAPNANPVPLPPVVNPLPPVPNPIIGNPPAPQPQPVPAQQPPAGGQWCMYVDCAAYISQFDDSGQQTTGIVDPLRVVQQCAGDTIPAPVPNALSQVWRRYPGYSGGPPSIFYNPEDTQPGRAAIIAFCKGSPPPVPAPPPPVPPPAVCPPCVTPPPPPPPQPTCDITPKCTVNEASPADPIGDSCKDWQTIVDAMVFTGQSVLTSLGDSAKGGAVALAEVRHLLSCLGDNFSVPDSVWTKLCHCYDREKTCSMLNAWGAVVNRYVQPDFKASDLYALMALRSLLESLDDTTVDVATTATSLGESSASLGLGVNIGSL